MKPLNICTSIFLLVQFLFWTGQAAGEVLSAQPRTGPLLTNLKASYTVNRKNITTEADLTSFKKTLDQFLPGYSMNIWLNTSSLDLFPADFFQPYNVTGLYLEDCSMSSMPYDLIRPLCSKNLQHFAIYNSVMASPALKLTPGGFEGCTGLLELWLDSVIQEVPIEAFRGLDNLKELTLQWNQIQRMDVGFEGIQDTLEYLNMAVNPISSVPKDAFEGWTKMTLLVLSGGQIETLEDGTFSSLGPKPSVVLSGNPLNCTCDLEWLQIWYQKNPIDMAKYLSHGFTNPNPQAVCETPLQVPLAIFDYEYGPYKCGAQQMTSFGILAILIMTFTSHKMLWEI